MAVRAVLAVGFLLLVLTLGFVLFDSEQRQAGSNHVPEVEEVVKRRGDWRRCQDGEIVPEGAAALLLRVGTYGRPTPPLRVTARGEDGDFITDGSLPFGQREGHLRIPVRTGRPHAGERARLRDGVRVRAAPCSTERVGGCDFDWLRDGQESWFALLSPVADRFALGKANPLGGLLILFAGLILLASWALAVRIVLREVRQ